MRAADFAVLSRLVRGESGALLDPADAYAIAHRLEQLARAEHHDGLPGLFAAMPTADAPLRRRICEAVAVHETRFFRDERMWTGLARTIVPNLLAAGRSSLVIWCAAVASGQEAYSLAMMLREAFPGLPARILATDLSGAMIDRARAGVYSRFEASRGLSAAQRARHGIETAAAWRVAPELRAMVEPEVLNLAGPWPGWPAIDLILLRNVLVYLDPSVRRAILDRAHGVLASDGALVLGAAESCIADGPFACFTADGAVFYRPQPPRSFDDRP